MALSNVFSTDNSNIKYQIELIQNSQSIANNTSNITVKIYIYRINTGYETYGTGTISYKINGVSYTQALDSDDKITSTKKVFATKTVTINHSADGSKTVACSASISHSQFSSSNNSYNFRLTTIPRASTPTTVGTVNIGSAIQINTNRESSSFTHKITYKFGSATGTIGNSVGSTINWTIPASLANQIKTATSGTLTITCETYNDSTKIGTKSITRTACVPNTSAFKPSISSVTLSEGNSANTLGAYIQGISKLKVVTAASGGYSDISSIKVEVEGSSYTGATITSGVLKKSGSATVRITVTDSRKRTATTTKSYSATAYTAPKITTFKAVRCLQDGTETDEGEYLKVNIVTSITSITGNTTSLSLGYKEVSATDFTNVVSSFLDTTPAYSYSTSFVTNEIFSNNKRYNLLLTIGDKFSSVSKAVLIGTDSPVYDVKADKTAICFGGVANESNVFDIRFPKTILSKNVYMESGGDQSTEKNIYFSNENDETAAYKHNCKLYGGNGTSTTSIGFWDSLREELIWQYRTDTQMLVFNEAMSITGFDTIATATIDSNVTLSSTDTTHLSLTSATIVGGGLTLSGGGIIIGAGISHVKISASAYYTTDYTEGDKAHLNITRNDEVVASAMENLPTTYQTLSIAPKIIAVSEGDKIGLAVRNQTAGRGVINNSSNTTYLTVEVIK